MANKIITVVGPGFEDVENEIGNLLTHYADNSNNNFIAFLSSKEQPKEIKQNIKDQIAQAVAANETPILWLYGHGIVNRQAQHEIGLGEDSAPSAEYIEAALSAYETAYKAKHPHAAVPPLTITVSSCFSEGILLSLPENTRRKITFITSDSQLKPTHVGDEAVVIDNATLQTDGPGFFLDAVIKLQRNSYKYTLPLVSTNQGVLDGDYLHDRVITQVGKDAQKLSELKQRALAKIDSIPAALRDEARIRINALSIDTISEYGSLSALALIGYLTAENPYLPSKDYRKQGEQIRIFMDPKSSPAQLEQSFAQMDENSRDLLRQILSQEADSKTTNEPSWNKNYLTPRYAVLVKDNPQILRDIIENGIGIGLLLKYTTPEQINSPQEGSINTLLQVAVNTRNSEATEALLAYGANPNLQDKNGMTALHIALYRGNSKAPKALLAYGANPNLQDKNGMTALHIALYHGDSEATEALLAHGANPNLQDKNGVTALHVAASKDDLDLFKLLYKSQKGNEHASDATVITQFKKYTDEMKIIELEDTLKDQEFNKFSFPKSFDANHDNEVSIKEAAQGLFNYGVTSSDIYQGDLPTILLNIPKLGTPGTNISR